MEADGQRLYSVLTITEVREKMMKEILQISEVFSLSQSDATVILIRLRWNSFKASDLLGDDKEKFLAELGLAKVLDSNQNESDSSSVDHEMTHSDSDGNDLVSTPFCSHKFRTTYWRDYLIESLEEKKKKKKNNDTNEDERVLLSCIKQDCVAAVGPDTIEKLTEPVKAIYEGYLLGSFVESNRESIKWCPALECDYAVERHGDLLEDDDESSLGFGVVCLCGHTFCWSCQLESHRPVTCNNASLWCTDLLDRSKSLLWIAANTKRCPTCNSLVHINPDPYLRFVTCTCSHRFCYRCLRPELGHRIWNCAEVSVPSARSDYALTHHLSLWEASEAEMQKSKSHLRAIEQNSIPKLTEKCGLGEQDCRAIREAWMLIVQCRLVLKWSYVFGYFISDYHSAKKQYLDHLRDQATRVLEKHKGILDELMILASSGGGDITCFQHFKHKLGTTTTATGNYFHFFVKTIEDGLSEVKADAYGDATTGYWFCDRCTFQTDSFDRKCNMCLVPFESPPHVASGNNDTAVAHHQQVPNMPNNPFALVEEPPVLENSIKIE